MPEDSDIATPARHGPGAWPVALLLLGLLPGMIAYLGETWEKPWYRWFPLALVASAALAVRAVRESESPAVPGRRWVWLPLLGAGLALLATAAWESSPWLGWLAGLCALAGLLGWCGRWVLFRAFLPAFVLLVVVLSPPLNWDAQFVERLERLILAAASRMLFGLSVPHFLHPGGVVLTDLKLPRSELFTGLYGLPAMLAVGLVWLLVRRRGPVRVICTLLLTAALLLPGEVVRIVWGIAASDASRTDVFASARATYGVIGLWVVSFILFLSVDQFMRFLTLPRRKPDLPPASAHPEAPPGARAALGLSGAGTGLAWAFAAVALVLGAAQGAAFWRASGAVEPAAPPASVLPAEARFTLPEWPDWWSFSSSNSLAQPAALGTARGTWHRQRNDLALAISISGPLAGFPSPLPAYQEMLWRLTGWAPVVAASSPAPPCAEAELKRDNLFRGVLWFGVLDESGRWLEPADLGGWTGTGTAGSPPRSCYLVQALAVCPRLPSNAEREEVRRRFEEARQELARQLAAQLGGKP
jgi:hypothetical protein